MQSTLLENKAHLYRSADKTQLPINKLNRGEAQGMANILSSNKSFKGKGIDPRESNKSVGL